MKGKTSRKRKLKKEKIFSTIMKHKTKAWAVVYLTPHGLDGLAWRGVIDGTKRVFYPRIFMAKEKAQNYIKDRSDYKAFKIISVKIIYELAEWRKEFDKEFTNADEYTPKKDYEDDSNVWAEKAYPRKVRHFISDLLTRRDKEMVEEIEKIMRDTLSADTGKYHEEVDNMYKKLAELKN